MKPTFVVYGNCNATAFCDFLKLATDIPEKYEVVWGRSFGTTEKPDLSRCEQLWVQHDEGNPLVYPDHIPVVTFPPCNSSTLWPFSCYDKVIAGDIFPYGDDIIRRLSEDNSINVSQVWDAYQAIVNSSLERIATNYESDKATRLKRDQATDVGFSDFFEANFRKTMLQMTYNHPRTVTLKHMFLQLCSRSGIDVDAVIARMNAWNPNYEPFNGIEVPVLEQVAKHFGLEWWSPDQTWAHHGKRITTRQYIEAIFTYRRARMTDTPYVSPIESPTPVAAQQRSLEAMELPPGFSLIGSNNGRKSGIFSRMRELFQR